MSDSKNGIVLTKNQIIIGAVAVILLLGGGVLIGANWNRWFGSGSESSDKSDTVSVQEVSVQTSTESALNIDPNAGSWEGKQPENKDNEAVGIKIPGYPSITIQKDTKNVTMALLNPEGNPCYFKFEIVLKDTGETIFESQYVPPGQSIIDVELTKPLAEGEYDATIMITTIALDQKTPLNGANVETVLIAK